MNSYESLKFCSSLKHYDDKEKKESFHPALIGKVTAKGAKTIGLQRIYLDESGKKANVSVPKKVLGKFTNGSVKLSSKSDKVIHLTEGIETALAVYTTIEETTYACVSATNLKNQHFPVGTKEVHIWADKDRSSTGEVEAIKAAKIYSKKKLSVYIHLPDQEIPEKSKSIDWLDVLNITKDLIKYSRINTLEYNSKWGDVLPIVKRNSNIPELTEDYLPDEVRAFVTDAAQRLGAPNEFIAVTLITIASILIGRKVKVLPKRYDDSWEIIPNLWCLIISRPSQKKTPAINMVKKHLQRLINEIRKEHEKIVKELSAQYDVLEIQIDKIKKKVKDLKENEEDCVAGLQKALVIKKAELNDLKEQMREPRIEVNSTTVEKLLELFEHNERGLLMFRDEISGFFNDFNKKGHESDRQFYLEAWNGNGSFTHDTISRGTTHSGALCASVMGTIQPDKFKPIIKQADDGLIQRFQLAVFPDVSEYKKPLDIPVDKKMNEDIYQLFKSLRSFNSFSDRIDLEPTYSAAAKYSLEAQDIFDNWMDNHDKRLHSDDFISTSFEDHLGKYSKLVVSLSLIFHMIKCSYAGSFKSVIQVDSLDLAIKWAHFLEKHAEKIYSTASLEEIELAYALAKKVKSKKITDKMTVRNLIRKGWKGTKERELLDDALKILIKHNYIKLEEVEKVNSKIGRPSFIIRTNPTFKGGSHE